MTITTDASSDTITFASSGGSGGASNLTGLSDVTISSISNGQHLQYNSTSGVFENLNIFHELEGNATNGAGFKSRELVSRGVIATGTGCVATRTTYTNQTINAGNPNGWYYGNGTLTENWLYALPVTVPGEDEETTTNISHFICMIGSSSPNADTTIGMGLYTLNKYGMPSQRVSHGSAAITTSTAASSQVNITPSVTAITPGRYAMCISNLGSNTVFPIAFNYRGGEGASSFVDGFGSVPRSSAAVSLRYTSQFATSMPTSLAGVTSGWGDANSAPHMSLKLGTAYTGE